MDTTQASGSVRCLTGVGDPIKAMFARLITVLCAALLVAPAWALQPQPLPREGSCPSGYSQSGNYCNPSSSARYAVPKVGSCPSGYSQSGNYCLASGSNSRLAVPKVGSCPSGYSQSGDYCLSSR
jgi:hypothetical protein